VKIQLFDQVLNVKKDTFAGFDLRVKTSFLKEDF
jgi:hypothetical protein